MLHCKRMGEKWILPEFLYAIKGRRRADSDKLCQEELDGNWIRRLPHSQPTTETHNIVDGLLVSHRIRCGDVGSSWRHQHHG